MCGVIGLLYHAPTPRLGAVASELLRTLEYRGYDSTGGAFQDEGERIDLRKGVGAPSVLVESLGMVGLGGQVFCGQVRWATFGAVDAINAQPHEVRCKRHLYGAHNGNVTNSDALKAWLQAHGHEVRSDNDGEMVVHAIEHDFGALMDAEVDGHGVAAEDDPNVRRRAMRAAIAHASTHRLQGSFAAVICDPRTRTVWAIKRGSSLYVGVGEDDAGSFAVASSDLSSVLKRTQLLVPIVEGEFVELRVAGMDQVVVEAFAIRRDGADSVATPLERPPVRSRLQAADMALAPPYRTFMEQEIAAQEATLREVVRLFQGPSAAQLNGEVSDDDGERADAVTWLQAADAFVDAAAAAVRQGKAIVVLCCGSSYHAARAGAMFFDSLAGVPLRCALPGEYRGELAGSVRDGDVIVAVSQSGETKDLIDILNDLRAAGRRVRCIALVNNVNSTLAQEKADVVVPLRCGPEIAVPATKSFMNQLGVFYGLALRLGQRLAAEGVPTTPSAAELDVAAARFARYPDLLRATAEATAEGVEQAAAALMLRPSMHILATRMWAVAKEGALKIREVVLNHTEGYEASEFKHGPNTILGRNTVYGPDAVARLLAAAGERAAAAATRAAAAGLGADEIALLCEAVVAAAFAEQAPTGLGATATAIYADLAGREPQQATLDADYPLIYVCGPDRRDIALTVSQVNTHKIRRSASVLIAEPDEGLRQAIVKPPADNPAYQAVCIDLPRTGDPLAVIFTATIVLQRLALRMSEGKAAWLDARGVRHHGVHPDVPKNVSKSITVD